MQTIKRVLTTLLFVSLFLIVPQTVFAETSPTTGAGFTITPEFPKNQLPDETSFFDLKVTPDQTQELTVVVANKTNQARSLTVQPTNATTGDNGVVVYTPNKKRDSSAKYTFTQLTSKAVTVKLAANEAKPITFTTQIPKKGFQGQILGGIFVSDPATHKATGQTKGFKINNRYSMVLGVRLQENPNKKVTPDLALNQVRAGEVAGDGAVLANLQNKAPVLFGKMSITGRVYPRNSSNQLYKTTKHDYAMAPNSNFNYAISTGHHRLKAGKYTLKLTATSAKRSWKFTKNFTISQKEADKYNKQLTNVKHNWTWLYVLLAILGALLLAGISFWLGRRNKNDHSAN
ncbi:DUF916 and DUF3324 domain-containing protein [Furfurilactobacillus entadae]|uniref:DUF916 and DUF3324 domain-containing protein n=1 Tax=Furfurilactobacillus entadae TaxID=2922307 RepID=UPI0035EB0932